MICIGVDIGLDGAIAFLYANGAALVDDLPTVALPGEGAIRRAIDPVGLYTLLAGRLPKGEKAVALLERVHSFPGGRNTPQTGDSLGHSRGTIEAVLALARLVRMPSVEPQTWKGVYKLRGGKDGGKDAARALAQRLYPHLGEQCLTRVKDHNRAEAVLIARYLQRHVLGVSIEQPTEGETP